ncbi:MAG: hypothetical protein LBG92_10110 [Prevotellaceae bacterium]|jgi:cell division protein FtsI (penicillin-binding protein 3)|nr:hypothetical protein [Prevotellaceae bacterium]
MIKRRIKDRVLVWIKLIYVLVLVFVGYCIYGIIHIQYTTVESTPAELKEEQAKHFFMRGDILSHDLQVLAYYYPKFDVAVDFQIEAFKRKTIDRSKVSKEKSYDTLSLNAYRYFSAALEKFAGGKAENYNREFIKYRTLAENTGNSSKSKYRAVKIAKNIDMFQRDTLFNYLRSRMPYFKKHSIQYTTGIYEEQRLGERRSPFENLAFSVLGNISGGGDSINLSGIEQTFNDELNAGFDIISTIDVRIQEFCEAVLKEHLDKHGGQFTAGTIAVMEVKTGNIKAVANTGEYKNTVYENKKDIYNNAFRVSIDPGSTFKTVALMAALETGKITISDTIDCDEGTFINDNKQRAWKYKDVAERSDKELGKKSIIEIIEKSSNIGTAKFVCNAFGSNAKKFREAIVKTGITDSLNLSQKDGKVTMKLSNLYDMLQVSHGYQISLTPMHILRFYNAVANDGKMMKPRIVQGFRDESGNITIDPPVELRNICSKQTVDSIKKVLSNSVRSGTVYGISGKTGTAQMYFEKYRSYKTPAGSSRDVASFCGYFPEAKPRYSCIVVLYSTLLKEDEKGEVLASKYAFPVFKDIANKIYAVM